MIVTSTQDVVVRLTRAKPAFILGAKLVEPEQSKPAPKPSVAHVFLDIFFIEQVFKVNTNFESRIEFAIAVNVDIQIYRLGIVVSVQKVGKVNQVSVPSRSLLMKFFKFIEPHIVQLTKFH